MATQTPKAPIVDRALIDKYSGRGPRYTSYPTAPEWHESVGEDIYRAHMAASNGPGADSPLALYIHVPFCEERCSFCACNVIITPHHDISDQYVDWVLNEASLVVPDLNTNRPAMQFHLGGGTPTHLRPSSLDRLLDGFMQHFSFRADSERSIEVDSRVTTPEHLDVLRRHGFSRISMGLQDANSRTQQAINRVQGIDHTQAFIDLCREKGFRSVNIDLVYGLPYQSRVTFHRTVDAVYDLKPDRIALYNYAFLPQKLGHQRVMDEDTLPDANERFEIFRIAIKEFTGMGYAYIGMDHFARTEDELTLAQEEGSLQRNFMGFTTHAGTDLYSFGTSSITSLSDLYIQNVKKLRPYQLALQSGKLPIERGIEMSEDDRMRRWVIMELMCNLRVSAERFEQQWGHDFHRYFRNELPRLQPFIDDGLVDGNIVKGVQVTDAGQLIIRPICMVFDRYLTEARKKGSSLPTYSKTL